MRVALAASSLAVVASANAIDFSSFRRRLSLDLQGAKKFSKLSALKHKSMEVTPCHPHDEPDVGILACDCVADESSPVGGFCVDSERVLQGSLADDCDNPDYGCDCTAFDLTTGLGAISCDYLSACTDYNGANTCVSVTISVVANATSYAVASCYGLSTEGTPFPYEVICYTTGYDANGPICQIAVDSVPCASTDCLASGESCPNADAQVIGFDCTNTNSDASVELCSDGGIFPLATNVIAAISDSIESGPAPAPPPQVVPDDSGQPAEPTAPAPAPTPEEPTPTSGAKEWAAIATMGLGVVAWSWLL